MSIIKYLKEKLRNKPKVWFTSDLHFNHNNVIPYCNRPFKTREEMNEHIIKVWNETVKPQDDVWILGDFSLNPKVAFEIAPKLNGVKYLVAGNHDSCFIGHKKHEKMTKKYEDNGFSLIIKHTVSFSLKDGTNVLLSHLPYKPNDNENLDMRYLEFRPKDQGQILLHGHLHGRYIKKGRSIDVSWDAHNGKILSEDDVIALINDSKEFIPSHITKWYEERAKVSNESAD